MKTKKCMWCLKEFKTESNYKYCSLECKNKSEDITSDNANKESKTGFFQTIIDILTSWF